MNGKHCVYSTIQSSSRCNHVAPLLPHYSLVQTTWAPRVEDEEDLEFSSLPLCRESIYLFIVSCGISSVLVLGLLL